MYRVEAEPRQGVCYMLRVTYVLRRGAWRLLDVEVGEGWRLSRDDSGNDGPFDICRVGDWATRAELTG